MRFEEAIMEYSFDCIQVDSCPLCDIFDTVTIEAEHALYKTSTQLYPISDRSDPMTSPSDPIAKKLNTIGGENWATADQSITWEFEVPVDGMYNLTFRFRQNFLRGMLVYRNIQIDGETPFREMAQVKFPYGVSWQTTTLGGDEPYAIYLTKGYSGYIAFDADESVRIGMSVTVMLDD